jgi:glycosyltransferase involved in cell wall biosynthesis
MTDELAERAVQGTPTVSIVMPTYNRADRMGPTLDSIRGQTFADFECIIVDDGSKDADELERVIAAMHDDRFRVIRTHNRGASAARNTGIDAARGDYIALLDSDDQFLPEKLARSLDAIRAHDGDCLVFTRIAMDRGVGTNWIKPPRGPMPGERIDEYIFCARGWVPCSTVVLPAKVAREVRFDEALPSTQDTDFAIRCATTGMPFVYLPEALSIGDDVFDPKRVSKQPKYVPLLHWIDRMRGKHVSERAYWAYRGWHAARSAARARRFYGARLYLQSLVHGAYPPKLALVVGAQVLLPTTAYQRMADGIAYLFGRRAPDA